MNEAFARSFWQAVARQDAQALAAFFAPDAAVCWPCSNERFTVSGYIRANCEYPGAWQAEVERVLSTPNGLVTAARVWTGDASFHAVSFFTLEDGKIKQLEEYRGDDLPVPDWRKALNLSSPIR